MEQEFFELSSISLKSSIYDLQKEPCEIFSFNTYLRSYFG